MTPSSRNSPEAFASSRYAVASSQTEMAKATEVSLKSETKSFVIGGRAMRSACGKIMRRKASKGLMPKE